MGRANALPDPGPVLRVVVPVAPSLRPDEGPKPFQIDLWRYAYASLLRPGRTDGAPDLARACLWDEDSRTLVCSLNDARRWSDGKPIRAESVKAGYRFLEDRGLLPLRPGPHRGNSVMADGVTSAFRRANRALMNVDVTDSTTVVLEFAPRVPEWLARETAMLPLYSQVEIDRLTGRFQPEPGVPPPQLPTAASYRRSDDGTTSLRRSTEADPSQVPVRAVQSLVFPGPEGRVERVISGHADVAVDVEVSVLENLVRPGQSVRIHDAGPASVELLLWNVRDKSTNVDFRAAVGLAIDRSRLAETFRVGEISAGHAGVGFVESTSLGASGDEGGASSERGSGSEGGASWDRGSGPGAVANSARPLEAARRLGFTEPPVPGTPPWRTIDLIYDRRNPGRERMATFLAEDLAHLGIRLRPLPLDGPEVWERFLEGRFQAVLLGFRPPPSGDVSSLWASWGAYNGMGYSSSVVDSLYGEFFAAPESDRDRLARLIESQVERDAPANFLLRRNRLDLVHTRVRGYAPAPGLPLGDLSSISFEMPPVP